MTEPIRFLNTDDVLAVHQRMIFEYGGGTGLRDRNLLESAVHMPQSQFGGQHLHDGLPGMAAAYLFHLCKNHPFVDGNKRVALATAVQFIYLNDHTLVAGKKAVEVLTLGVADGTISKEQTTAFFKSHVRRERTKRVVKKTARKSSKKGK